VNLSNVKKPLSELKPEEMDTFYNHLPIQILMAIGFPIGMVFCAYHFLHDSYIL
jgi:hypothetical protein